jgi:HSP20 family protein
MKAMTMYRPNTIQNALSDFDRYFESFFGDSVLPPSTRILNRMPSVDVRETDKSYVLDMELPGYDEKDIEIHIDGASLSIASKHEDTSANKEPDNGTWLLRERHISSFTRSFKLPENANQEEVNAEFKNGILKLEIGKRPEAQKRVIRINVK